VCIQVAFNITFDGKDITIYDIFPTEHIDVVEAPVPGSGSSDVKVPPGMEFLLGSGQQLEIVENWERHQSCNDPDLQVTHV